VLRRATKQLQRQAAANTARMAAAGVSASEAGWARRMLAQAQLQAAAWTAHVQQAVLHTPTGFGSSSSLVDRDDGLPALQQHRAATTRTAPGGRRNGASSRKSTSRRGSWQQRTAAAGPGVRSPQRPAAPTLSGWDVLLLSVTWDADAVTLLKHRAALGRLSDAAAAAGVTVVPVLLVEGSESALSVPLTDMRATSSGAPLSAPASGSNGQALLQVDAAAAQLASALGAPSVPVFRVPVAGLLAARPGASAADLLRQAGGLEQQHQLLLGLHRLQDYLAGRLQQQLQQQVPAHHHHHHHHVPAMHSRL
jgi:hypothetical protein